VTVTSTRAGAGGRSALRELASSSTKEFLRNPKLIVAQGFAFVFILLLSVGLDAVLTVPFLRDNLGMILAMGVMSVAFMGTTVPLVTMRERGTLRLFGTTPVSRLSFVLAQLPVRSAVCALEAGVVLGLALALGRVDAGGVLRFLLTAAIGSVMLVSIGFLFAARSRNAELATQLTGFVPVVVLATSGTAFPIEVYPEWVRVAFEILPTTWFMQAVNADLNGVAPFLPVSVLWVLMLAAAVVATLAAARLFGWDDRER
jgi:ABC-2 type transport system permease protein